MGRYSTFDFLERKELKILSADSGIFGIRNSCPWAKLRNYMTASPPDNSHGKDWHFRFLVIKSNARSQQLSPRRPEKMNFLKRLCKHTVVEN
jgi:hypothetical protein